MKPLLLSVNLEFFHKILNWKNIEYELVGNLIKVKGFDDYNRIIDINSIFSSYPFGHPIDRTNTIHAPFKYKVLREWKIPTTPISFDDVVKNRVEYYNAKDCKLNLCWSGGLDSTCMLVGFLKYSNDLSKLRVIYSPYSEYENRNFLELLKRDYPQVELMDISGTVYLDTVFDGMFINGHCGDEFTSSLDDSFYERVTGDGLFSSWKDYFYAQTLDTSLVEFAENYFQKSGKQIDTLLEARWWFYASNKSQVFPITDSLFTSNQSDYNVDNTQGFYDTYDFESYMYFNTDQIISNRYDYKTHKQFMKEYIYAFDHNEDYYINSRKNNSRQFGIYTRKKICMTDSRWIAKLDDSTIIRTPNLPLFSRLEFERLYGNSLDYLFNEVPNV